MATISSFVLALLLTSTSVIKLINARQFVDIDYAAMEKAISAVEGNFASVHTAKELYGIPNAHDGALSCSPSVAQVTLQETIKSDIYRPQVLISGEIHGDERVGVSVSVVTAQLLVWSAECQIQMKTTSCQNLETNFPGLTQIQQEWLTFLATTRHTLIVPAANCLGYIQRKRSDAGVDPNRDFSYDRRDNKCFMSTTAKIVRSIMQSNVVQMVVTFHGGMIALGYEWGSRQHMSSSNSRTAGVVVGAGSRKDISPDDVANRDLGSLMAAIAGSFKGVGAYPVGSINSQVYPVDGGMEDWLYGSTWNSELDRSNCIGDAAAPPPASTSRSTSVVSASDAVSNPSAMNTVNLISNRQKIGAKMNSADGKVSRHPHHLSPDHPQQRTKARMEAASSAAAAPSEMLSRSRALVEEAAAATTTSSSALSTSSRSSSSGSSDNMAGSRALVFLVETSNAKNPPASELGGSDEILDNQAASNGHIARNVRLALSAIDMVQPYVCVNDIHFNREPVLNKESISITTSSTTTTSTRILEELPQEMSASSSSSSSLSSASSVDDGASASTSMSDKLSKTINNRNNRNNNNNSISVEWYIGGAAEVDVTFLAWHILDDEPTSAVGTKSGTGADAPNWSFYMDSLLTKDTQSYFDAFISHYKDSSRAVHGGAATGSSSSSSSSSSRSDSDLNVNVTGHHRKGVFIDNSFVKESLQPLNSRPDSSSGSSRSASKSARNLAAVSSSSSSKKKKIQREKLKNIFPLMAAMGDHQHQQQHQQLQQATNSKGPTRWANYVDFAGHAPGHVASKRRGSGSGSAAGSGSGSGGGRNNNNNNVDNNEEVEDPIAPPHSSLYRASYVRPIFQLREMRGTHVSPSLNSLTAGGTTTVADGAERVPVVLSTLHKMSLISQAQMNEVHRERESESRASNAAAAAAVRNSSPLNFPPGRYALVAWAAVDQGYAEAGQGDPRDMMAQSHLSNVRANPNGWYATAAADRTKPTTTTTTTSDADGATTARAKAGVGNGSNGGGSISGGHVGGRAVKGRKYWPSDATTVVVNEDGTFTVESATLRCAWWRKQDSSNNKSLKGKGFPMQQQQQQQQQPPPQQQQQPASSAPKLAPSASVVVNVSSSNDITPAERESSPPFLPLVESEKGSRGSSGEVDSGSSRTSAGGDLVRAADTSLASRTKTKFGTTQTISHKEKDSTKRTRKMNRSESERDAAPATVEKGTEVGNPIPIPMVMQEIEQSQDQEREQELLPHTILQHSRGHPSHHSVLFYGSLVLAVVAARVAYRKYRRWKTYSTLANNKFLSLEAIRYR